jgi:mannitol-1-phosphate 5-dehydrogenase
MKIALQFGAGNIGRGFMGQLFWEAGYKTWFVEYSQELVSLLNDSGSYPLRLLDAYSRSEIDLVIDNFGAVTTSETERVTELFAEAEVVGTAVGVRNLEAIAPIIAGGIAARMERNPKPVDIFLCENVEGAGAILKESVFSLLTEKNRQWAEKNIGFVGTSVARMVPAADKRFAAEGPLFVVADSFHKLPFDEEARRAPLPPIEGLYGVSNFKAEVERKLYTHNLGHAAMGYIGYLNGYKYVHEPFDDAELLEIFDGALGETAQALVEMYPQDIDADDHRAILKDVRVRFGNPMLMDALTRVAQDPMRKLGPSDRLVGSARLCEKYGIDPRNIALICGAAFCYDYEADKSALELQSIISRDGIEEALRTVSRVEPSENLGKLILEAYYSLMQKKNARK